MDVPTLSKILGWSALINLGMLTFWFLAFVFAGARIHQLHSRWFKVSRETFDAAHYCGLGIFKLAVLLFNVAPWAALQLAR